MREDMDKIIVERARPGSRKATTDDPKNWQKRVAGKHAEFEDMPLRESMNKKYKASWDEKHFNENLNPLQRFLLKNVGRHWDDVYSEICERINRNSVVQNHIIQHVFDFVEKNTFIGPDGKVWYRTRGWMWNGGGDKPITEAYADLFVHPKTGQLCLNKHKKRTTKADRKRQQREKEHTFLSYGAYAFHKRGGIWYILEMRYIPEGPYYVPEEKDKIFKIRPHWAKTPNKVGAIMDHYLGSTLAYLTSNSSVLRNSYGRTDVYCACVKQANSKELKRHGLANDRQED
jgi:hypothetical protein